VTEPAFDFGADRAAVDAALSALATYAVELLPGPVGEAIRYSLEGGGKRLRGVLFLAVYRAVGGAGSAADLAAAIEAVHAYSLVHDDLPCMDDDDMRRGRPTVHRAFTVEVATAAGLAMVPLAAGAAARAARTMGLPSGVGAQIVEELMRASGAGGMVGGQLLDLEGEDRQHTLSELERIHRAKTGALIAAAVRLGGLSAGADRDRLAALDRFGASVGLAFQIADDVLDVTATTDELGKTAGKDVVYGKTTYPALLGIDGAIAKADALVAEGCAVLVQSRLLTPDLERLARFIIARRS
jgi:geranylgeranyl diphosphate synthase, type II